MQCMVNIILKLKREFVLMIMTSPSQNTVFLQRSGTLKFIFPYSQTTFLNLHLNSHLKPRTRHECFYLLQLYLVAYLLRNGSLRYTCYFKSHNLNTFIVEGVKITIANVPVLQATSSSKRFQVRSQNYEK